VFEGGEKGYKMCKERVSKVLLIQWESYESRLDWVPKEDYREG
jgi:hypothetical protein